MLVKGTLLFQSKSYLKENQARFKINWLKKIKLNEQKTKMKNEHRYTKTHSP